MTSSPLIKPERQGMSFAFDWVDCPRKTQSRRRISRQFIGLASRRFIVSESRNLWDPTPLTRRDRA